MRLWREVERARRTELVPTGYGVHPDEPDFKEFDEVQVIAIGRRNSSRSLTIQLPKDVWEPRLILWLQSLETMYRFVDN